jgi:hypothetical protein
MKLLITLAITSVFFSIMAILFIPWLFVVSFIFFIVWMCVLWAYDCAQCVHQGVGSACKLHVRGECTKFEEVKQ